MRVFINSYEVDADSLRLIYNGIMAPSTFRIEFRKRRVPSDPWDEISIWEIPLDDSARAIDLLLDLIKVAKECVEA